MIDSVMFHIEDLQSHQGLVDYLHRRESEGFTQFKKVFDKPLDIEDLEKRMYHHDYFTDHTDGHVIEVGYRNFIRSYHYEISYKIDFNRGQIDFNFSIPKYLYGTNVFQFVPHYFDREHSDVRSSRFSELGDLTFHRFTRFITWFCAAELGGLVNPLNLRYTRIDLCYNKFFNSKEDALQTLADIKRIRKKFLRDTSKKTDNYLTGIYHVTSDYTFKIYHKGDEFKAHDRGEIKKKSSFSKENVEALQGVADRILRYEVEFRGRFIDKLFKKHVFRRDSDYWALARKYYLDVSKTGGTKLGKVQVSYSEMTKFQKKLYKYGKHYYGKNFWFYLESPEKANDTSTESGEIFGGERAYRFPKHQRFSKLIMREMFKVFKAYYRQFSVSNTVETSELLKLYSAKGNNVSEINEYFRMQVAQANKGFEPWIADLSFKKMEWFHMQLKQYSWFELKPHVPSRTYYRYKKVFSLLGFSGDVFSLNTVPRGDDTFLDYFREVETNRDIQLFADTLKTKF